jgi:glucose/arabinose dehydrogenase
MTFYNGKQFPAEYRGDIFSSQHGSWNRSIRTGYELIRVPLHQAGKATGDYEDFMTGFVVDNAHVWGRPVGVTVAADGALLVTDDGSNSIWRVVYVGK